MRRFAALSALAVLLFGCGKSGDIEPLVDFTPIAYEKLNGWRSDNQLAAALAFKRSCDKLLRRPGPSKIGKHEVYGTTDDWRMACDAAAKLDESTTSVDARRFFEAWFQPFVITADDETEGLFTGYYEPLLFGSKKRDGHYAVPLYLPPDDLVRVDLGKFDPELEGRSIRGRIDGQEFIPYHTRDDIDHGALAGRDLELVWVDDEVEKFFLQIQGSGQVQLDDGSVIRVGYADQNGLPYRAIGRDLIEIGALTPETVSLQTIRQWLKDNPGRARDIMARNKSYIFFRENTELNPADGPLGAQNVPLTAGRSLAVDPRHVPLGTPLWLETTAPWPDGERPLRRLVIAQDTGGAIKGAIRGDVFWGAGERAEAVAGRMKSKGRYFVLVPRAAIPTS
ncbi:MAG: MltA domain-containing protein [Alphaproteobacteria bacterium]